MSNAISRRAFLKCAGASALAVGAASLLGGCNLVDKTLDSLAEQISGASGIATAKMGNSETGWAMVTVGTKTAWWTWTFPTTVSSNPVLKTYLDIVGIDIQIKNYQNEEITMKASDITDVTVDGRKAKVLTNTDAMMKGYDGYSSYAAESLFRTGDSKQYPANKNLNTTAVNGYVFFELEYADNEERFNAAKDDWSKVRFTLKLNGDTKTFEVYKNNGNVTSKVV